MDSDTASQFVSCLVRCIQAFCQGYVQFSSSIEIVGHIYLNVDKGSRFNYIVNEEVSKNPGTHSTVYNTNSYHSLPPAKDMLLNMSTNQDLEAEFMPDSRGVKNMESFLSTVSSALPPSIEKTVSAAHPVSLIKIDRTSANRLETCSQKLPHEMYKNKSPPLPLASDGLPKERTRSMPAQKQETTYSDSIPFIVIKQEPEIPFLYETNLKTEEELLAADEHCEDDNRTFNHFHPLTSPRRRGTMGLELLGTNVANLPEVCDSLAYETTSSHPTKSLSVQIRQQIVAYANIVGNRPAARHFGVHESSIRHWRKKFAVILQSNGERRERKRRGDFFRDIRDEAIEASGFNMNDSN